MEQRMEKKEWKTPELIILVRSKPEEAVLAACKTNPQYAPGPGQLKKCSDNATNCRTLLSS